jgi:hypothetical protein
VSVQAGLVSEGDGQVTLSEPDGVSSTLLIFRHFKRFTIDTTLCLESKFASSSVAQELYPRT